MMYKDIMIVKDWHSFSDCCKICRFLYLVNTVSQAMSHSPRDGDLPLVLSVARCLFIISVISADAPFRPPFGVSTAERCPLGVTFRGL